MVPFIGHSVRDVRLSARDRVPFRVKKSEHVAQQPRWVELGDRPRAVLLESTPLGRSLHRHQDAPTHADVCLRPRCPINFTLELLGDPWSLLVVRDIVYFGKRTFGEFLGSAEGIARNILSDRLTRLEERGILLSATHPTDRRKELYTLTERGIDLVPLLLAAADWGAEHAPGTDAPRWWIELVRKRRDELTALIREAVRDGRSVFVGDDSVAARLAD